MMMEMTTMRVLREFMALKLQNMVLPAWTGIVAKVYEQNPLHARIRILEYLRGSDFVVPFVLRLAVQLGKDARSFFRTTTTVD